jgi:hypothetical protein
VSVTAYESVTSRTLHQQAERGATGRLVVGAGAAEIAVYLVDGHVLATATPGDARQLIERLARSGKLPKDRAEQLRAMLDDGGSEGATLSRQPILDVLSQEVPEDVYEDVLRQRFDENLARFLGSRSTPRVEPGVVPWADNIQVGEPTTSMLIRCAQAWSMAGALDEAEQLVAGPRAPTTPIGRLVVDALGAHARTPAELVRSLDMESIAARAAIHDLRRRSVLAAAGAAPGRSIDPAAEEDDRAYTAAVSEDDLDAFSGELDRVRGGEKTGTFVTRSHNLDRIEILDLATPDDSAAKAREGAYAAPSLTEADALGKIEVANDVLTTLAKAIDQEKGAPRGASTIQILVDGRPRPYVALFEGVRVTSTGGLPSRSLLENLRRRPPSEQRRLLNQGLLDLLDRSLDKAADEISERRFDTVLERVMGYRQRMGL